MHTNTAAERLVTRNALIVASYDYDEPQLKKLRSPVRDAEELARVLGDADIGRFDVETLINGTEATIRRTVETFFKNRTPDDVLLLHFSCHGVKDDDGNLYFAATDTELARLESTAIAANFVNRQMNRSRSRRVLLLLDCCYSGAFARGQATRGTEKVELWQDGFEGKGRVVLTASSATEYAFEGDEVVRDEPKPSVFTAALVQALESGKADRDQDGRISVDELYDWVYDDVQQRNPNQTPSKWSSVEGQLYVARSSFVEVRELDGALQDLIGNTMASVRETAVRELRKIVIETRHAGLAEAARRALKQLTDDDSKLVSAAAVEALNAVPPSSLRDRPLLDATGAMTQVPETADATGTAKTDTPAPQRPVEAAPQTIAAHADDGAAKSSAPPGSPPVPNLGTTDSGTPIATARDERITQGASVRAVTRRLSATAVVGAALVLTANFLPYGSGTMFNPSNLSFRQSIGYVLEDLLVPVLVALVAVALVRQRVFRSTEAFGLLLGFGIVTVGDGVCMSARHVDTASYPLVLGGLLILAAGASGIRATPEGNSETPSRFDGGWTWTAAIVASLCTAAGVFLPRFAHSNALFDTNAWDWYALEPLVAGLIAAAAGFVGIKRRSRSGVEPGIQTAIGAQLFLFWIGDLGYAALTSGASIGAGTSLGALGAIALAGFGWYALRASRISERAPETVSSSIAAV